jgi:nickel ABC transporter nickel/metallophore binding protein
MNRISKVLLMGILLTMLLACNTGCEKTNEKPEKQISVAVSMDVGVDQLDANSYDGLFIAFPMIYDSLVEYGDKGKIIPSLAESWEISDDGKTYIFHLRKGVKFSDGTPLDADAVKFSLDRWIGKPEFSNLSISKAVQLVEVVDPYTIKLVFNTQCYTFLNELTYPRPVRIISPSAVEPKGDPQGKFIKPIGTGPWMIESYHKDQDAVLIKNPYYWGEKPKLDKIILKVIPDSQSRILALQSGDVDLVGLNGKIPPESLNVLKRDEKIEIHTAADTLSYFIVFNYDNEICQDINVRKAINMAIDKNSMVANLMEGIGKPAEGLFPYTVPYVTNQNNKWYPYNKEKAKELLHNAGYIDKNGDGILEKNGKPLEMNLVLQSAEFPEWKTMCEYVQSQLKEVGIKVNLQSLEQSAYYDDLWKNRKYDLIIYRTYSDPYDPHGFLIDLFHKKGNTPAVVWSDTELEKYIDEVIATMDEKERQQIYDQIFQLMYERAMCVPLYYNEKIFVVNTRVEGFEFGTSSSKPIRLENLNIR